MIDKNKKYTTRSGVPVRIYATDGGGPCSVHGAILICDAWKACSWTSSGEYIGLDVSSHDLIEVKPRIQRTEWFNIYRDGTGCGHKTQEEADSDARLGRIACIQIPIDCEEGEGL